MRRDHSFVISHAITFQLFLKTLLLIFICGANNIMSICTAELNILLGYCKNYRLMTPLNRMERSILHAMLVSCVYVVHGGGDEI